MKQIDNEMLSMALVGYEAELLRIDGKISELRGAVDGRDGTPATVAPAGEAAAPVRKRRRFSAAARKRMAESQRKRWAAMKKAVPTKNRER